MSEFESRLNAPIDELRRLPHVDERALQRLRKELRAAGSAGHAAPGWRLMLSPARAAVAAALLVLATSGVWAAVWLASRAEPGSPGGRTPVQFVFVATAAQRVALVGDFNDWDVRATPLARTPSGIWSVVVPLEAGRFSYSFVVDDRWYADPQAVVSTNDFGRPGSVLLVSTVESAP